MTSENGIMCGVKKLVLVLAAVLPSVLCAQQSDGVGASSGPGIRYASDAYPGFDTAKSELASQRKGPKWFAFINGPVQTNATEQLAYCRALETEEKWSKAVKQYDALVRQWPASAEAPEAQQRMAELLLEKLDDPEESMVEYRYLVDFYPYLCDYDSIVDRMYSIACLMRLKGKTILFFPRFKNTSEVRRTFEGCVLRAPGASWTPTAMLTIGALREEEGKYPEAVKVYENLRNLHDGTSEAKAAVAREAEVRMKLLEKRGYNRDRCLDTVGFLKLALGLVEEEDVPKIREFLAEAEGKIDDEAYAAAKFYDTRMRTQASAISAYERFLAEHPESRHAAEVRARLEELKGAEKK